MKVLEVHSFKEGIHRNIAMLNRLGTEMDTIQRTGKCDPCIYLHSAGDSHPYSSEMNGVLFTVQWVSNAR